MQRPLIETSMKLYLSEDLSMSDIERALQLKENLIDFVYDAEGAIAVALESYAADKGTKNSYGIKQQNLTVDLFLTQGQVEDRTPLDLFIETSNLSTRDRSLVELWHGNIIGLFEIQTIEADCYQLMNWLTTKTYKVYGHSKMPEKETSRWQPGEIILVQIAPINEHEWFFFSDRVIKGRLSQPKLAVAIGEFRDNYPEFLYADAPQLLEQAWESVAVYHQEFVDYMGGDRITMPGYKLNQKIAEIQQIISRKKLADAGIDDDKSLSELLAESGQTEEEFTQAATDLGADAKAVTSAIKNKDKLSMVTPKVDLPPEIKQAESVTVFSHPRWGQMFLPTYEKFTSLLASEDFEAPEANLLVRKYLEQPEANYYVWQQLKQQYPQALEKLLSSYLDSPNFSLDELDKLLLKYDKSSTPELPAIASVPIHLNNLFEAAVAQVQKTKSKSKKKKKKGFLKG